MFLFMGTPLPGADGLGFRAKVVPISFVHVGFINCYA
jgi:hypothetical protein